MKNIKLTSITFIALTVFFGCKTEKNVEKDFSKKFLESFDKKTFDKELELTQVIDTTSYIYIPLETKENCLIGEIRKVLIYDEFIFVFDRFTNSLYVFDKEGKFIRKIGKTGQGPGEYGRISDFDIDQINNEIILYDINSRKFLFYDFNGVYLGNESIGKYCGMNFVHLGESYYAFYLHRAGIDNFNSQLLIYHNQKVNEQKQLPFKEEWSPQIRSDYFSKNDTNIYILPTYYDEIYKISKTGKLTKVFDFNLESIIGDRHQENALLNFRTLMVNSSGQFYCGTAYNGRGISFYGNLSKSSFVYGTHFNIRHNQPEKILGTYRDYFFSEFHPSLKMLRNKFPDATQGDNPGILLFKMKI